MKQRSKGFTIIEVMIVLAIAGLIMLLVFLAVPAAQRVERNHNRKEAVNFAVAQMQEYYSEHGSYPLRTDHTLCSAVPNCDEFRNTLSASGPTKLFTIDYADNQRDHFFPFTSGSSTIPTSAYDIVVIFPAHSCNRTPGIGPGNANYPVYSLGGIDTNFTRYAVYTVLEPRGVYCIDNTN